MVAGVGPRAIGMLDWAAGKGTMDWAAAVSAVGGVRGAVCIGFCRVETWGRSEGTGVVSRNWYEGG